MNQEMVEILTAIYRLEIVKELYDQRIIGQENYKEFLMSSASGVIELNKTNEQTDGNNAGGSSNG
jgi:hypothetical protein